MSAGYAPASSAGGHSGPGMYPPSGTTRDRYNFGMPGLNYTNYSPQDSARMVAGDQHPQQWTPTPNGQWQPQHQRWSPHGTAPPGAYMPYDPTPHYARQFNQYGPPPMPYGNMGCNTSMQHMAPPPYMGAPPPYPGYQQYAPAPQTPLYDRFNMVASPPHAPPQWSYDQQWHQRKSQWHDVAKCTHRIQRIAQSVARIHSTIHSIIQFTP